MTETETETMTPIVPAENGKAFAFTPADSEELFHITYEGEFVFADGVEAEEAAKTFAKFFTEEMAPFVAVMSAARSIAVRSLRRPHADSILIPIELYDDLCNAVRLPRTTE